jgi:hypothetical protein
MPRKAAPVNDKTDDERKNGTMGGLLDLSGADTSGGEFPAMPAGTYDAEVVEITMRQASGNGKLPQGTPMLNVHFRITEDTEVELADGSIKSVENRRVFRTYPIAPEGYENKAKMDGIIVGLFTALGDDQETVMSADFDFNPDDYKNRPCRVTLSRELRSDRPKDSDKWEDLQNNVKSVKAPAEEGATAGLI